MIEKYVEEFYRLPQSSQGWLLQLRKEALNQFQSHGFPSPRAEAWRNTNIQPVTSTYFPSSFGESAEKTKTGFWNKFPHITFCNGKFVSTNISVPGVEAKSFVDGLSDDETYQSVFRQKPREPHAFYNLNTSLVQEGAVVRIAKETSIMEPIFLVYYGDAKEKAQYYRNLIVLESRSKAKVVEVYIGEANSLTVPVTQIHLERGAELTHVKIHQETDSNHIGVLTSEVKRDSRLKTFSLVLDGPLVRNDIQIRLNGKGSEAILDGLYVGKGKQVIDHHTLVNHAEPHGTSSETYKGILMDDSQGVFEGKVVVAKDAQKTSAYQMNRNLLLSENARAHTAPQLEILADDVKCTHGATVGRLDENQIFYLRSRGVEHQEAIKILVSAYAQEVISKIGIPELEDEITRAMLEKIR